MRRTLAVLAVIGTLVDAAASWYSIEHLGVAVEGNPVLSAVAETFGFTVAMVLRGVIGTALIGVLYVASIKAPTRARRIATVGLWASAIILAALAGYHVFGLLFLV